MKIVRFVDNWHHYCIQFHEMKPLYTDVNEFTQTKADRKYSYLTCWHGATKHMAANLGEIDRYVIQITGWV